MKAVSVEEFADRAMKWVLRPQRNPLVEAWGSTTTKRLPKLGIFSDIPRHKFRSDEAQAWARAGFEVVICDGEHSLHDGFYGREQYEAMLRLGMTPIQRLPRDAGSQFGDALTLGARGVMRPYGTTAKDLDDFLEYCRYPDGTTRPSALRRGAFPLRRGDGTFVGGSDLLRAEEQQNCLVSLQFESSEYVLDETLRRHLLQKLSSSDDKSSPIRSIAFLGAIDLAMRATPAELPLLDRGVADFLNDCRDSFQGCAAGGIFGDKNDRRKSVDAIKRAIQQGALLIVCPYLASELPFVGAYTAALDFHTALAELGLGDLDHHHPGGASSSD